MTTAVDVPANTPTGSAWKRKALKVKSATAAMIPIGELARRTGLTISVILAAIAHPRDNQNLRAALRAVAQPRWCVGGGEPMWDQSQIAEYFAVVERFRSTDRAWAHLPRVTVAEARRAGLASLSGMGVPGRGPGLRKTNLDRWKKREHFPEPVARIDVGPSPKLLYVWMESPRLEDVLSANRGSAIGMDDDGEWTLWLRESLAQPSVRAWLHRHNPSWVAEHRGDPNVDMDAAVPEP